MIRKHWLLITVVLVVPVLILLLAVGGYFVVWPWLTPAVAKPRPVITVEAVYPGANAQIVADAVAAPSNSSSTASRTWYSCIHSAGTTEPTR